MKYDVLRNVVNLLEEFEADILQEGTYPNDIEGFKRWIVANYKDEKKIMNLIRMEKKRGVVQKVLLIL